MGGGFGAKISRNTFISSATALAAYKLNRPVRMSVPFETNMEMLSKRYPFYVTYDVGVNDTGVIQYMQADLYSDFGNGGNEPVDPALIPTFENCYDLSTWNFTTYTVVTDMPANGYMRAPGKVFLMDLILKISIM